MKFKALTPLARMLMISTPRLRTLPLALAVALAALAVPACDRPRAESSSTSASPGETSSASTAPAPKPRVVAGLKILEMVTGGASIDGPLPLVVFVHGMGDRPQSFISWFIRWPVRARVVLPQAPTAYGSGFSWFTYPSTQEELERGVRDATARLASAVEELERDRPSSRGALVGGFSQGGMLTFALAALRPDLVAHVFPVSGLLPASMTARTGDAARRPTVFAMHGDADAVVPIAEARRSVAALSAAGLEATLREYPGVGHTVTPAMHSELEAQLTKAASLP